MRRLTEFPTDAIIIILQNVNPADILCLRFTCKLFTTLPMLALRKTTKQEEWKSQRYKYEQSILAFRRYELDYYRAGKTLDLLICNKCGQLERAHSVVGFPDSASSLLPQVIKTRECIACRVNRFKNLRVAAICETAIGGEMMFICWLCKEGQPYSEDALKWFLALSPNKIAKYMVAVAALVKHKFCKTCWRNRKLIGAESENIEKPETTDYTELIRMMEKMFPKLGKLGATKEEMDKITQEEELAAEFEMLTIAGEQKRKFEREEAKRLEEEARLEQEEILEKQEAESQAMPDIDRPTSTGEPMATPRPSSADDLKAWRSSSFHDEGVDDHRANNGHAIGPAGPAGLPENNVGIEDSPNRAAMDTPVAALLSTNGLGILGEPQYTTTLSMENDARAPSHRGASIQEIIARGGPTAGKPKDQDADGQQSQHPFTLEYIGVSDDADATDQSAHDSDSESEPESKSEHGSEQEYRNPQTTTITKPSTNKAFKKLTIPARPEVNSDPQSHQAKVESDSESGVAFPASTAAAEKDNDDAIIAESSEDNLVSSDFSTDYSDVEVDDYDLAIVDQVQPTTVHKADVATGHGVNPGGKDVHMRGATDHDEDGDADDEFEDDMGLDVNDVETLEAAVMQTKTTQDMDMLLMCRPGRKM